MNLSTWTTTTLSVFAVKGIIVLIATYLSLEITSTLLHILEVGLADLLLYTVHQLHLLHADVLKLITDLTIEVEHLRDVMNDIDEDAILAVSPMASVYESEFHVKFINLKALFKVMRWIEHALSSRNSLGNITPLEHDYDFE